MMFLILHFLTTLCITSLVDGAFVLNPISTVYLHYDLPNLFRFDRGAAEISAFDPDTKYVYTVGDKLFQVVDFSTPPKASIIYTTTLTGKGTHIELCNEYAAVAMKASSDNPSEPGNVAIFSLSLASQLIIEQYNDVEVGPEPSMLTFTENCRTLLVANEGGADESADGTTIVDPEGTITILRFPTNDLSQTPDKKTVNFNEFDSESAEYESKGVRIPYKGALSSGTTTFSQSMEPEYITLNSDESLAYVTLQENNAIAVIDIALGEVVEIYPMGQKDWSQLQFDSSDTDLEINLRSWPLFSLYQPDVAMYFQMNDGEEYLAMVNEGKVVDYETSANNATWTESIRGNMILAESLLADGISQDVRDALLDNNKLGRLQFSRVDGLDQLGKIEKLHFYGGRGWSIVRVKDMSRVYDSGDELERKHAELLADVFNADSSPDSAAVYDIIKPSHLKDMKSDDTGPECESIVIGDIDGKKLFFIGVEGSSSIAIYSMDSSLQPQFESLYRAGNIDASFKSIYDSRHAGDLDPEGLRFISAEDSPTGKPSLLVTGTVSGTVSLYEIVDQGINGGTSTYQTSAWLLIGMTILSMLIQSQL
ncbi:mesenchyme-specific cell surface glycoprotein-like [Antedon mediterranea]|uniref:mesenchyme-specific cell surface glycoprotein-like n=1 Tax=Antedon mediterranea TaxID=105859 RepID=UPI003AF7D78C